MSSAPAPSRSRELLGLLACVAAGAAITLQSKVNGELAARLGHGLRAGALAAVISFGSGLLVLSVALGARARGRRSLAAIPAAVRGRRLRWWQLLGGLAGASLVAGQAITVGTLGVALFVVAVVAGQSSSALAVDHAGVGPRGRQPVTAPRVVGAGLAVVAVILGSAQRLTGAQALAASTLLLALLPLLAGAATSWQQAVNARVAAVTGSWPATWNNFLVGTTALCVLLAIALLLPGHLTGLPTAPWLYLGGLIGISFIYGGSVLVRRFGVLIFGLGTIAGQLVCALVVDAITAPDQLGPLSYVGAAITLVGVAVATIWG